MVGAILTNSPLNRPSWKPILQAKHVPLVKSGVCFASDGSNSPRPKKRGTPVLSRFFIEQTFSSWWLNQPISNKDLSNWINSPLLVVKNYFETTTKFGVIFRCPESVFSQNQSISKRLNSNDWDFLPKWFLFWAGEPSQKKPKSYNQNRWSSFGFQVLGYLLRGYLLIKGLLKIIHKLLAKWPRFHVKKSSLFAGSGASQYVYIYIYVYIYKHTMGYKIYFQCRGNIFYFSISLFIYHAFTYWFIYLSKSVYLFSYLFIELFIYMLAPPPRHIFCHCHYLTELKGKVPPCPTPGCLPTSTRVEPCFTAAP